MNNANTVEEAEAFEVMLDLLIKKLIGVQTDFEQKKGTVLKTESVESKHRKDLLGRLIKSSDRDSSFVDEINTFELIINADLKQEYAPAILKAKSVIEKISSSFTNLASDSANKLLHLNHLREVRNFKNNGQFSDNFSSYEKCSSSTSTINSNESDTLSQDISFEETRPCIETDNNSSALISSNYAIEKYLKNDPSPRSHE